MIRECTDHAGRPAAVALMALAACLAVAVPAPAQTPPSPPAADAVDPGQVADLVARLQAALAGSEALSAQQVEGRLQLVVANSQARCSVAQAAVARLVEQSAGLAATARAALQNLSAAAGRCAFGPAAGPGSVRFLQQGTTLGLPGGSSNYLPGQ